MLTCFKQALNWCAGEKTFCIVTGHILDILIRYAALFELGEDDLKEPHRIPVFIISIPGQGFEQKGYRICPNEQALGKTHVD